MSELREIGFSYQRVADYLNGENIKAKFDGIWYGSSVRMVLLNGVYNEMFEYVENNMSV